MHSWNVAPCGNPVLQLASRFTQHLPTPPTSRARADFSWLLAIAFHILSCSTHERTFCFSSASTSFGTGKLPLLRVFSFLATMFPIGSFSTGITARRAGRLWSSFIFRACIQLTPDSRLFSWSPASGTCPSIGCPQSQYNPASWRQPTGWRHASQHTQCRSRQGTSPVYCIGFSHRHTPTNAHFPAGVKWAGASRSSTH